MKCRAYTHKWTVPRLSYASLAPGTGREGLGGGRERFRDIHYRSAGTQAAPCYIPHRYIFPTYPRKKDFITHHLVPIIDDPLAPSGLGWLCCRTVAIKLPFLSARRPSTTAVSTLCNLSDSLVTPAPLRLFACPPIKREVAGSSTEAFAPTVLLPQHIRTT